MNEIEDKIKSLLDEEFVYHITNSKYNTTLHILHKDGIAYVRIYTDVDSDQVLYIDSLSVSEIERGKGIATKLLNIHHGIAKYINRVSMLFVEKNSWMYEWYGRNGYEYYSDYPDQEGSVWMVKKDI